MHCPATPRSYDIFFFNDTPTTEIYTLSLHDALPIFHDCRLCRSAPVRFRRTHSEIGETVQRSEEHTSELQSRFDLVCRLLLEKKNIFAFFFDHLFLLIQTEHYDPQRLHDRGPS